MQCKSKEYVELQHVLSTEIDESKDSLRFYLLGNNYKNKIIHIGAKPTFDVTEPLIFKCWCECEANINFLGHSHLFLIILIGFLCFYLIEI